MIRTQVSLAREEYDLARKETKAQGVSVAHFVRMAIRAKVSSRGSAP
jgi:hypothetical protein